MFQVDWAQKQLWEREKQSFPQEFAKLKREAVRRTALLHWEEHCHECAPPLCYTSCSLYVSRQDKKCCRFVYGIYPNPNFRGLFDFGADIRFRRWGKLEAIVYGKSASARVHRLLDRVNRFATRPLAGVSDSNQPANSARTLKGTLAVFWKTNLAKVRTKYLSWMGPTDENIGYDAFVLECFSPDEDGFRLILEYFVGQMTPGHTFVGELKLRHSFNISPGWNFHTLPAQAFRLGQDRRIGKITIYPENSAERRLIFTWLNLVKYQETYKLKTYDGQPKGARPAAKVKCVAWDLDDTVWKGILVEDSGTHLRARPEALELIKKLDERGIVQTIVSKNNFADAWHVIERLGLQDYFLHPAINWQPKSSNLKEVAAKLNLNPDAFALIDDSPFERAEVQSALPQVRVYSEDEVSRLLTYDEFDVPVSESSKKRRASYLTEIMREKERETFGDDYKAFLRSCEMELRLFVPREEGHILRCLELIQRANQLNLSNTRYTAEEFRELLSFPGILCIAMECSDRFGDYGIVGFASVDERPKEPILQDLVISCRVAQKKVEHTLLQWLAVREARNGSSALLAALVKTDRNEPLAHVLDDLHFTLLERENGCVLMKLPLDPNTVIEDIVKLEVQEGL